MKSALKTLVLLACALTASASHSVPVALELSLVIDVSGSVSTQEYALQTQGYRNAFQNSGLQTALLNLPDGIAVNVIQFADNATVSIGWTHLTTAAQINSFATAIGGMARAFSSGTDVQDGILLATSSILTNGFEGRRRVIDVSGDGHQNSDPSCTDPGSAGTAICTAVREARDAAAASGITINGLAIEDGTYGTSGLTNWYIGNVKTGNGFVETANDFADFDRAVLAKIGREAVVPEVSEPGTLGLTMAALAAAIALRRRSKSRSGSDS